ncbi:MAG TPA: hypothetical protein VIX86_21415 [Streptosporangiaceae bacterium]
MNQLDHALRERLHRELTALPVPPPPLAAVRARGRATRNRRRGVTATGLALLAGLTGAVVALPSLLAAGPATGPRVTMSTPGPSAPGGVFASGTAAGRPWRLALRNIAGPGGRCLPAVMLNGGRGDLLYPGRGGAASPGYPAFLTMLPGGQRIGYGFVQLRPGASGVVAALRDGRRVTARPVTVPLCGRQYLMAGFVFAGSTVTGVTTVYRDGQRVLYPTGWVPFPDSYNSTPQSWPYGLWENVSPPIAGVDLNRPVAWGIAGQGRASGVAWQISVELGAGTGNCGTREVHGTNGAVSGQADCWGGECYRSGVAVLSGCLPITAPPATASLLTVPVVVVTKPHSRQPVVSPLMALAGQVNPRAGYLIARLSDGSSQRIVPVTIAGRRYIALAVPLALSVKSLSLYTAAGNRFAVIPSPVGSCGVMGDTTCETFRSSITATLSASARP